MDSVMNNIYKSVKSENFGNLSHNQLHTAFNSQVIKRHSHISFRVRNKSKKSTPSQPPRIHTPNAVIHASDHSSFLHDKAREPNVNLRGIRVLTLWNTLFSFWLVHTTVLINTSGSYSCPLHVSILIWCLFRFLPLTLQFSTQFNHQLVLNNPDGWQNVASWGGGGESWWYYFWNVLQHVATFHEHYVNVHATSSLFGSRTFITIQHLVLTFIHRWHSHTIIVIFSHRWH
jgi:hypothetical protein